MTEQAILKIKQFEKLPNTKEKEKIQRQYLNDEISSLDFYSDACDYLEKIKGEE